MAYVGITASEHGLRLADGMGDVDARLQAQLRLLPAEAPVVVLVHGYKFDPSAETSDNPHRSLYSFAADPMGLKVRSWPAGLGFDPEDPASGLCLGYGWPAAARHVPSLLASGRTGFAQVYHRAALYGRRLAELIARVQALAPGRAVDVLAHSLGARVALEALPHLEVAPERMVLLGAAEFDARAREALAAAPSRRLPQIYNVTARSNDFYDAMFETFAPRRSWAERAVGLGLRDPLPCWLDLQLDRDDLTDWVNARGIDLIPSRARLCHWSFYTRGGAFEVYQAILRRRPGWDIATLRAEACLDAQEPRWSRLAPAVPRALPRPRLAGGWGLGLRRA